MTRRQVLGAGTLGFLSGAAGLQAQLAALGSGLTVCRILPTLLRQPEASTGRGVPRPFSPRAFLLGNSPGRRDNCIGHPG